MDDFPVVPLLHSVSDMMSRDTRVAATERIQRTVNTLFPQKSKHESPPPLLCHQDVWAESKCSSSTCSTSRSGHFTPKAALDVVQIRKVPLSHIGIRTADRPARCLVVLVLFLFDAYVA